MALFQIFAPDLGIDLGTANTLVYKKDGGIVLDEPSMLVVDRRTEEIIAIGENARKMLGKTPDQLLVVKPLERGAISDFDMTQLMLEYFISKACPQPALFRPRVVISVPSGVTDVERRAVEDAALHSGVREAYLLEETLASAVGSGLGVDTPMGMMVINLGAGTTEVAVVSMGGVVTSTTLNYGGDVLNARVMDRIHEAYDVLIGENTAEVIKVQMASLASIDQSEVFQVTGREDLSGLPKDIVLETSQFTDIYVRYASEIIDAIHRTLEKTPPEFSGDIVANKILLAGGGSLIPGLGTFIERTIGIPTKLADEPLTCTALGTGIFLSHMDILERMAGPQ